MAPTVLRQLLFVLGVYAAGFGGVAVWTFRDFSATRARVDEQGADGSHLADAFLLRVTVLLGLAAAAGTFVTLRTFLIPLPPMWLLAIGSVADGVATAVGVQLLLRSWPRLAGRDPLAELRSPRAARCAATGEAGEA